MLYVSPTNITTFEIIMIKYLLVAFSSLLVSSAIAQSQVVTVETDDNGTYLMVDGEEFIVNGMNWEYIPIGQTSTYNFWSQSDEYIANALDYEMPLVKAMGVNTLRLYSGIQPQCCLLYTSPSPRDGATSRMPSSA